MSLTLYPRVSQVPGKISMAAGSVAAGGLYMQSELSQLKNKRLQEFGVQVQVAQAAGEFMKKGLKRRDTSKKVLPNM